MMLDIVVAFRLWLGRKVFGFLGPKCIRISLNRIVKGPTLPAEAAALLFVAENTNIRVPKVYHTYDRKDGFYIEMEYIRGQTVEEMWATISMEEKDRIIKDLAACVNQLRQLEPKVLGIGSSDMGQTKDLRLSFQPFGPFKNIEDFHAFVRKNLPLENCKEVFGEEVFLCHSSKYSIRMSHSDICLRNLIIDWQGRLAIIDWEFAGWRPEYWEYTKSFYAITNTPDFYELIRKHFANYDVELKAERHLWRVFDQPWASD
jgi:aminoglycoside phosphotransferase